MRVREKMKQIQFVSYIIKVSNKVIFLHDQINKKNYEDKINIFKILDVSKYILPLKYQGRKSFIIFKHVFNVCLYFIQ